MSPKKPAKRLGDRTIPFHQFQNKLDNQPIKN